MRIHTPKAFAALLKREKPSKVLIVGTESAFVKKTVDLLIDAWGVPKESVREFFDPSQLTLDELSDALFSASLFSSASVVILRDCWRFIEGLSQKQRAVFKRMLEEKPSDVCLIMISEEEGDLERLPVVRFVRDLSFEVVNCRKARPQEMKQWLKKRLRGMGLEDEALLEALVEASGGSMEALQRELEKLTVGGRRDSISNVKGYTPWDLLNLMVDGDWRAFEAFDYLVRIGVSYLAILSTIQLGLRNMLLWKAGVRSFSRGVEIMMERSLQKIGVDGARRLYKRSIELEKKLKFSASGDLARRAFEEFIAWALVEGIRSP